MRRTSKRIISFVMAVLLTFITVIGNVSFTVHAEEKTTTTYTKVTSTDEVLSGGEFVLVAGGYAVGNTVTSSKLNPVQVNVNDTTISGDNIPVWNISAVDGIDNGITLKHEDSYLQFTGTKTNIVLGSDAYNWKLEKKENGSFEIYETTNATPRALAARITDDYQAVGAYSTGNSSDNNYSFGFSIYKVGTATVDDTNKDDTNKEDTNKDDTNNDDSNSDQKPQEDTDSQKTTVVADGSYVIYNPSSKMALSSKAVSTNYRAGVEMALNAEGKFDDVAATEIWNVKNNEDGTVSITCSDGTLSVSSKYASANFLETNEYTTWILTASETDNNIIFASPKGKASKTGLSSYLKWDASKTDFTTNAIADHDKDEFRMQFIAVGSTTIPEEPTPEEPTPDKPVNGDFDGTYVIYNEANKMALSSVYSGNFNSGVTMTTNAAGSFDSVIETEVWTITKNENGSYTISQGEDKLSMDTEYSSMPLNKVNDSWEITKNDDGTVLIKNAGRGNYIEWYASKSSWSSYYKITDSTKTLFNQKLIKVSADIIKSVKSEEPDPEQPAKEIKIEEGLHYIYSSSAKGIMQYGVTAGCASFVEAELNSEKTQVTTATDKLTGAAVLDFKYDSEKEAYVITCGGKYLAANSAEELYLSDSLADTTAACTYWVFDTQEKFAGYTIKSKSVKYNNYDVYMEYYSSKGFCLYTAKTISEIYMFEVPVAASDADSDKDGYAYGTVPVAQPAPKVGGSVIISNDANSQVISAMLPGTDGSKSTMGAVNAVIEDGKVLPSNGALIFNVCQDSSLDFSKGAKFKVTMDDKGYYTFITDGKYLTASEDGKKVSLEDSASDYSLWKLETNGEGFYIVNVNAVFTYNDTKYDAALEYYSGNFTLYEINRTNKKYSGDAYTMQFYTSNGEKVDSLSNGSEVVIYNPVNKMALTSTVKTAGKLSSVSVGADAGGYYYFENNGKYLATNNDEALLMQDELNDMAKWELIEVMGGYLIKNKAAAWTSSSGNSYPIYIEYFSGSFAGYSYKATSKDIFTFNFYPVEDTYKTGYVINPRVDFKTESDANLDVDYTMSFVLDDLGEIQKSSAEVIFEDDTKKALEVELKGYDGTVVVSGKDLIGHSSMTIKVNASSKETDSVTVDFSGEKKVAINDNPVIKSVTPGPNAQTGKEKQPKIVVTYANIGENAKAVLTLNGKEVKLTQDAKENTFNHTPESDLEDGKYVAVFTVTRADGKAATKTWSFNVGYSGIALYFGQIHSHTAEYSDGSGTLEQAYEYAMNKAADIDYMIVTDHSNYFDTTQSAVKDSIYKADASSISKSTTKDKNGNVLNLWQEANATASYYNGLTDSFRAGYGYEMTWSGGPGHINVFNSLGIVSRNNTELNTKTNNSGMLTFYDLLVDANSKNATYTGDSSISAQFNHPGTTFGYFDSFTGWNKDRDAIMNLIEVGNGDGAIGGKAYFPSYEYYDMCLTVGWHVAPTNGQDNHKGAWGDSNTARTVAITSDFTESGLYDAMNARHIYSTEDQNLSMIYYLNDTLQGGIIDCKDEKVKFNISLSDKDPEGLGKVYVIGLDGKVLYTSDYISENTADLEFELKNTDPYYYVKVVQKDGDIAVSAPVWVADVAKESAVTADITLGDSPVEKKETNIKATLSNDEAKDISVKSYSVSVDGKTVENKTLSTTQAVKAGKSYEVSINWTPDTYGTHEIKVAFTYLTSDNQLVTKTASKKVYVKGADYDLVTDIKTVKAGKEGVEFTIEGYVTANTSGYDKNTAFFDCTYVQDSTAGINVFPVSKSLKAGQKVRAHGAITFYNGEIELNLSEDYGGYIEVIDENVNAVNATTVSTKDAMLDENIGLLMKITGTVTKLHEASGVIDRIYVKDASGTEACVYINGYIWNSKTQSFTNFGDGALPKAGDTVTVIGIGSVDVDELGEVEYLHRLRIRDRAEISVTANSSSGNNNSGNNNSNNSSNDNASSSSSNDSQSSSSNSNQNSSATATQTQSANNNQIVAPDVDTNKVNPSANNSVVTVKPTTGKTTQPATATVTGEANETQKAETTTDTNATTQTETSTSTEQATDTTQETDTTVTEASPTTNVEDEAVPAVDTVPESNNVVIIIIICVLVLALGGAAGACIFYKKKKSE